MTPPPLSLYIHIPWCLRKCPYCDFNSHAAGERLDEDAYVDALLADLAVEAPLALGRPLQSIFIGGGTPSLFSPTAIERLLCGVRETLSWAADIEITLEANPGAVEASRFAGYRAAGVDRLSLGVQSFDAGMLRALGRIHGPREAVSAVENARAAGFERINLDLMFGLPGQTPAQAESDLRRAIELATEHLSYYQLTLEPNTPFHRQPPRLPDHERIWEIQQAGHALLAEAGFVQYEVSAFARAGGVCRHNLNYWRFGDYLGIGAGAHGKVSDAVGNIRRRWKQRHPEAYLRGPALKGERSLSPGDRVIEFMMNALRLSEGVEAVCFERTTGLSPAVIDAPLRTARARGLMREDPLRLCATELGARFLNDLLELFDGGEPF
ncbi:MAG: radical SAM family heme chaperone HemW [Candidatus Thiodiazotropha sp.]